MAKKHFWKAKHAVLLLVWAGWMIMYLITMAVNIALPFMAKDLNLDPLQQGMLVSAFFIGYGGMQIPSGILSDRFGFRKVMMLGVFLWSILTILFGLVSSLIALLLLRVAIGAAQAMLPPPGWKAIGAYFPGKERASAISIQYTAVSLGPALATPLVALMISLTSWRTALILVALPGFFLAWAIHRWLWEDPAKHPHITKGELTLLQEDQRQQEASRPRNPSQEEARVAKFRRSVLWRIVLIWGLQGMAFWTILSWMPTFLLNDRGFSLAQMGVLGMLPFIVAACANVLGGYMSDRAEGNRKYLFVASCMLTVVFLITQTFADTVFWTILTQTAIMACLTYCTGVFWGIVADFSPNEVIGTITATVNFGAQVGGFISPFIVAAILKYNGNFTYVFLMITGLILLSAFVTWTTKSVKETS